MLLALGKVECGLTGLLIDAKQQIMRPLTRQHYNAFSVAVAPIQDQLFGN